MNTELKIFISYRRADSPCFAERIRDWFMLAYERENVFMDFDAIPPFVRFEEYIIEQIRRVDVVLAIIGPKWMALLRERMQSDDTDYVRIEIGMALKMGKLVAPILVDGARPPNPDDLPEDIRPMMRANAPTLNGGRQFLDNIERLVNALPLALDQHRRLQVAREEEASRMLDPMSAMHFHPAPSAASLADDAEEAVSRGAAPPPRSAPPRSAPAPMPQTQEPEAVPDSHKVLLCYAREDEAIAERLYRALQSAGFNMALDRPVAPHDESLRDAAVLLALVSPASKQADWLQHRIASAQAGGVPILPVLAWGHSNEVPYAIAANEMVYFQPDSYDDGLAAVKDRLAMYVQPSG
ncbi:MAG: toll/interleukin-1 receptor domain-containing protein [Chloroflexota bacterium]